MSRNMLTSTARDTIVLVNQKNQLALAHPIIASGHHLGWVRIEMSRDSANENLAALTKAWLEFVLFAVLIVSAVALGLAYRLTRGLNQPDARCRRGGARTGEAALDVGREDEIGVLARHLDRMLDALSRQEEKIRNLAFYDTLTKLPNRRLLLDRLGQVRSASKRSGRYAA